jgi:hypothetical protein
MKKKRLYRNLVVKCSSYRYGGGSGLICTWTVIENLGVNFLVTCTPSKEMPPFIILNAELFFFLQFKESGNLQINLKNFSGSMGKIWPAKYLKKKNTKKSY